MKSKRQLSEFDSILKVLIHFFWVFVRALNYTDLPITSPRISLIKF